MVINIVGRIYDLGDIPLGTCFLVNEKHIFTALHNFQDKKTKEIIYSFVNCKFEYKSQASLGKLIYEDIENDFAILELNDSIESEFYRISKYVIEKKDEWESSGYPSSSIHGVNFSGQVTRKNRSNRYEVYINYQEDSGRWSGASGAPVIIEDEIAGIILEQEYGGNLKTRLEIVSIEAIIDKLKVNKPEILDRIEFGYHPLLQGRLKTLSDACKEVFHISTESKEKSIFKYHVFQDNNASINHLADILKCCIHDYGVELLLEEEYGRVGRTIDKRKVEDKIDRKKHHIKNLIINNSQLIHMLLWILIEGELEYPRIGSYIIDERNNIPRDIYLNDNNNHISILIGNGYLDESILTLFEECISEIDSNIQRNKEKKHIVIMDKLVVESLNYSIQDRINSSIFHNAGEAGISISVAILIGFNYETVFKYTFNNDEKIEYLKNYVDDYEKKFMDIIEKSNWVSKVEINWFFIPFEDVNTFNEEFKKNCR